MGDDDARFWSKVDKNGPVPAYRPDIGPCWLWTGSTNAGGYGTFGADGRSQLAHRWAYSRFVDGVYDGRPLDHLCRLRGCVNFERHLEPVTSAEHTRRSPIHYGARTHCSNGHEFTPENTLLRPDGGRRCLICKRESSRRSYRRKRLAA